jgi:hypothetical protein
MEFKEKEDIDLFFNKLSAFVEDEIDIYLLGGCALIILGASRMTQDIDFEVRGASDDTIEKIQQYCNTENVPINFSEDAGKWGMIKINNNRNTTLPYDKFGNITVRIFDPYDMCVGKIERFTDIDIQDVIFLIKKFSMKPEEILSVLAKALKESVKSEKNFLFRKQVESFIKTYSNKLWGLNAEKLLAIWGLFLNKENK